MVLDDENRFSIQNLLHPGLSVGLCLCIKLTDKALWIARKLQASKKQIAKRPAIAGRLTSLLFGAHGRSRTSDRLVRSQVLYPAELHALNPELRKLSSQSIVKNGGEGGIRTLDGR